MRVTYEPSHFFGTIGAFGHLCLARASHVSSYCELLQILRDDVSRREGALPLSGSFLDPDDTVANQAFETALASAPLNSEVMYKAVGMVLEVMNNRREAQIIKLVKRYPKWPL